MQPTERLYYADAYATEFDATIAAVTSHAERPALVLDRSAFYPTSGGQLHDTGTLGDCCVIDVIDGQSGAILHIVDRLPDWVKSGAAMYGVVDWARRYDHMQQHTGQHLLSQIFVQHFDAETASVHFGASHSTIEIDHPPLDAAQLRVAEQAANAQVFANLPIRAYFVDERALAALPLRRPPAVTGEIRIVEIEGFDFSACGGTHVGRTGEIGPIKLLRQEKVRGRTRIAFLCGWRALCDYAEKDTLIDEIAGLFSTDPAAAPAQITRLQTENKGLQRQLAVLTDRLLHQEAETLWSAAEAHGHVRIVNAVLVDHTPASLKRLAQFLQREPNGVTLLAGADNGKGTVVFACGQAAQLHAGNLLRRTLAEFDGGGGGRADFAQGGGVAPDQLPDLLATARRHAIEELAVS